MTRRPVLYDQTGPLVWEGTDHPKPVTYRTCGCHGIYARWCPDRPPEAAPPHAPAVPIPGGMRRAHGRRTGRVEGWLDTHDGLLGRVALVFLFLGGAYIVGHVAL